MSPPTSQTFQENNRRERKGELAQDNAACEQSEHVTVYLCRDEASREFGASQGSPCSWVPRCGFMAKAQEIPPGRASVHPWPAGELHHALLEPDGSGSPTRRNRAANCASVSIPTENPMLSSASILMEKSQELWTQVRVPRCQACTALGQHPSQRGHEPQGASNHQKGSKNGSQSSITPGLEEESQPV